MDVGDRLRRLRGERGYSVRALAERSGLAVNTISLIENDRVSPSVSTLQQIAFALGEPITAFFEQEREVRTVIFGPAGRRPIVHFAHGTLEDLGTQLAGARLLPLMVRLEPAADSGEVPIVHTGLEFVFCIAGRLEYVIEDQVYAMQEGDSLVFEAHLPHRWRNTEAATARALLILVPADVRDQPTDRHFGLKELSEQKSFAQE
ncbi:MAG: cupin domain-containing protein [Chloroflexota bacterium]